MSKVQITAEPGIPRIVITQEFDAPRDLVFRAYTDPELLVRWLGPREQRLTVDLFEVRDGGRWRYHSVGPDGVVHGFRGVFHGEPGVDGIVQTFEYEGAPGHICLQKVRFEENDGRTLVTSVSVYETLEDREGMMAGGAETGIREGDERLTELLAELRGR
jgi:uncharacterized protein YndB with AHSA1/START domain